MTEEINKIEIRSAEVDEIMGKSPTWIIRWGITVIFLVIASLLIGSYFFKYPVVIRAPFIIEKTAIDLKKDSLFICKMKIPINGIGKLKLNQKVNLKFDQYPYMEFGQIQCKISKIYTIPINDNSGKFYLAEAILDSMLITNYNNKLNYIYGLSGSAEIITEDTRLLDRFLNPIKSIIKKQ